MHPVRKQNRLADYDYSQPGAYFITVCTKDKANILSTIVRGDAHIAPYTALTSVGKVAEKYIKTIPGIDCYVIMPNHVHMILCISAKDIKSGPVWEDAPTEANIPSLVRSWKTLVSKETGKSIWHRTYCDHIVRDERDFRIRAQYIADNPAKWRDDDYYSNG